MVTRVTHSSVLNLNAALVRALLIALFTLFLLPIQIEGIGYNYSLLLLPLGYLAVVGKVTRPPDQFLAIMALYVMIFVFAAAYQFQYLDQITRRIISFILFMTMFSYMFVRIDAQMIESFKAAVVAISLLLSAHAMYVFFTSGASSALGFEAKDLVGSQRVGFLHLIAFWLIYLRQTHNLLSTYLRYAILLVVLSGLFLTFSRASIMGLLLSFGLFALANTFDWCRRPNLKGLLKAVAVLAVTGCIFGLLYALLPLAFTFFQERLFLFLANSDAVREDLGDMYSSGGTRVFLLQAILNFVLANPVTGSGYLGVWILPGLGGDFVASAHNQYADVLFRTGFPGVLAYLYLLFLLLRSLNRCERSLFWGLIAVLAYGMFHETFKESQGAFILTFLLGMLSQSSRETTGAGLVAARAETTADVHGA